MYKLRIRISEYIKKLSSNLLKNDSVNCKNLEPFGCCLQIYLKNLLEVKFLKPKLREMSVFNSH